VCVHARALCTVFNASLSLALARARARALCTRERVDGFVNVCVGVVASLWGGDRSWDGHVSPYPPFFLSASLSLFLSLSLSLSLSHACIQCTHTFMGLYTVSEWVSVCVCVCSVHLTESSTKLPRINVFSMVCTSQNLVPTAQDRRAVTVHVLFAASLICVYDVCIMCLLWVYYVSIMSVRARTKSATEHTLIRGGVVLALCVWCVHHVCIMSLLCVYYECVRAHAQQKQTQALSVASLNLQQRTH